MRGTWGQHLMLVIKEFVSQCDICGKEWSGGDYLKGHVKTVHEEKVAHCTVHICI